MNEKMIKKIEEFQCPGCVNGSDSSCGEFNYDDSWKSCRNHLCGTMSGSFNNVIALGLLKGSIKQG